MLRAARHPKDINEVRVTFRNIHEREGPFELPAADQLWTRRTHGTKLPAIEPERRFAGAGLRVLAVHRHGVVGSRLSVPQGPGRGPPAVLNGRITEVRQQIERLREDSNIHSIRVTMALAGIVIEPGRASVRSFPGAQDRQTPLGLVHAGQLDLRPARNDRVRDPGLEGRRVRRKQIVRQAIG